MSPKSEGFYIKPFAGVEEANRRSAYIGNPLKKPKSEQGVNSESKGKAFGFTYEGADYEIFVDKPDMGVAEQIADRLGMNSMDVMQQGDRIVLTGTPDAAALEQLGEERKLGKNEEESEHQESESSEGSVEHNEGVKYSVYFNGTIHKVDVMDPNEGVAEHIAEGLSEQTGEKIEPINIITQDGNNAVVLTNEAVGTYK